MVAPKETHGPDRCRNSLNCINFHDPIVDRADPLISYCCCNTCMSLRPGDSSDITGIKVHHCCRCVPRLIWLIFSPLTDDPCCKSRSIPMGYAGTDDESFLSTYTGSLYGMDVVAKLGPLATGTSSLIFPGTGTGTGTADACAWHITVSKDKITLIDITYIIDDITVSCLDVSQIAIGNVDGPNACEGQLSLGNMNSERLPFIRRTETDEYCCDDTGTGTGTGPTRFITLDPVCNDCTQVCYLLCIYGHLVFDQEDEYREFTWFDNGVDDRGWTYTDDDDVVYVIQLTTNTSETGTGTGTGTGTTAGVCSLVFNWTGSEIIADRDIDLTTGCSCGIKEVITANVGLDTIGFTIRCGFCSYWDFFCGTCRCVPSTLCANLYLKDVFYSNVLLTWNSTDKQWTNSVSTGTGTGTVSWDIVVSLTANSDGDCILTATADGEQLGETVIRDCGTERISNEFDSSNDFILENFSGTISDEYAWMVISSQDNCNFMGVCHASSCGGECGSHPDTLTANLHGWNTVDDAPGYLDQSCGFDIGLYHVERMQNYDGFYFCGYIGFTSFLCWNALLQVYFTRTIMVQYYSGLIDVLYRDTGDTTWNKCDFMYNLTTTESCDPLYTDTGVIFMALVGCCLSCPTDTIQRFQIIITE